LAASNLKKLAGNNKFKVSSYSNWTKGAGVLAIGAIVVTLYLVGSNQPGADKAAVAITLAAGVMAVKSVADAVKVYRAASGIAAGTTAALDAAKAARKAVFAAKVGAVLTIAVAWGLAFAEIGMSGASFASGQLLNIIATAVAQTIVALIMLAIALIPVVGQIIAAVIAAVDAIIAVACAAAGKDFSEKNEFGKRFCKGLSGLAAEFIKAFLYSRRTLVGNIKSEDRLEFYDFGLTWVQPDLGMVQNAPVTLNMGVTNTIVLNGFIKSGAENKEAIIPLPFDPLSLPFFWQLNNTNLKSATFEYQLQAGPDKADIHDSLERNTMNAQWQPVTGEDHSFQVTRHVQITTDKVTNVTGLNRELDLYLAEGQATPAQQCIGVPVSWTPIIIIPACWIATDKNTNSVPLGSSLIYDILPRTLDGFTSLSAKGGSYSLAWGQVGDLTFARQKDADGDGLINKADGGNDPDDSKWDTDGDGISDYAELRMGYDPTSVDSDGDGLLDNQELFYGTNPNRADTDRDGLTDKQEIDGWLFVYDLNAGGQLKSWVTSDPLEADEDSDNLTDVLERTYGFNPRVVSDPRVLTYESQVIEKAAPRLWLRFENPVNTLAFADSSGYNAPGACSDADTCPTTGVVGVYGNAALFDGVNDRIVAPISIGANTDLSWAGWLYPQNIDTAYHSILALDAAGGWSVALWVVNQTQVFGILPNGSNFTTGSILTASAWNHLTLTRSGSTYKIYVNGVERYSISNSTRPAIVQMELGGADNFFKGRIDEVAVFDHALSVSEVLSAQAGTYNPSDLIVKPSDTLAYTATVKNELLGPFANGLLYTNFPQSVNNGNLPPTTFVLQPQEEVKLSGVITVSAVAPSGSVTLTQVAEASIQDRNAQSNYAETWIKFDESGGVTFNDSSGNVPPRNATCSGSQCPASNASGASGRAMTFDGVDDFASLSGIALADQSFTIAFWAKRSNANRYDYAFGAGQNDGSGWLALGFKSNNKFTCEINNDDLDTAATYTDTDWHHWACTYTADSKQRTLYRDGLVVAQGTALANYHGSADLLIGKYPYAKNFKGSLDDVRVFKKVLSSGEIAAISNLPVLKLTFDTATSGSTTFVDSSGRGNTITCSSASAQCPQLQGGVLGSGPRFYDSSDAASANDYYSVTNNSSLNLNDGNFTLMAWISPITTTDATYDAYPQGLIGYDSGEINAMPALQRVGLKLRLGFGNGATWQNATTPSNVLTIGKWQQVAATYDGATVRFYVDGLEVNAQGLVGKPAATNFQLMIGRSDNNWKVSFPGFHVDTEGTDAGADSEGTLRLNNADGSLRDYCYTDDWDTGETHDFSGCWNPPTFDWTPGQSWEMWEEDGGSTSENNSGDETIFYPQHLYGTDTNGTRSPQGCSSSSNCNSLTWVTTGMDAVAFAGRLDEVAIYKRPFSAVEMLAIYDTVKGGLLFRLDEPPGSKEFNDETGVSKLTCTTCPTAGVAGRIAQGTQFVTGQYVSGPWNGGNLESSVSLWFKTGTVNSGLFTFGTDRSVWLDGSGQLKAKLDGGQLTFATLINALQSSTLDNNTLAYGAGKAIDGNVNTFNHTNAQPQEWWKADLAAGEQVVQYILVYNRQDCCPERLNDFNVILYNAAGQEVWRVEHLQPTANPNPTLIIVPLIRAKTVKVQLSGINHLSLGEVQVLTLNSSPETITTSGSNYADTQWHHLLYTFGGAAGVQKIYVDGVQKAIGAAYQSMQTSTQFNLGFAPSLWLANGTLDQVRLYSRGLTAADATRLYQDVPQGLFKFDDAVGATTFVNAANTGNATCSGANCPLSGVTGRVGLAAQFDGVDDALQMNSSSGNSFSGPFAISAWFNAKDWSSIFQRFIAYKSSQYYLWEQSNEIRFTVLGVGTVTMTVPTLNQWQHVVGNYTGGALQLWLNGSLAASQSLGGTPATTSNPLYIGALNATGSGAFAGTIDDLSLYNRYLSGPEINAQYLYQVGLVTERQSYRIMIDSDLPSVSLRSNTAFVPNTDRLMDINATDPSSDISLAQLGSQKDGEGSLQWAGAPLCRDVANTNEWCITFIPRGEGRYTLRPRAIDAVGHAGEGSNTFIYVDGTGPQMTLNTLPAIVAPGKQSVGWSVPLSGTVTDPIVPGGYAGSGVVTSTVRVTLLDVDGSPAGSGQQQVTLNGNNWQLDYAFIEAEPLGTFTIVAEAADQVGNASQFTLGTIKLDSVGPVAELSTSFAAAISSTTQFSGTAIEIDVPRSAGLFLPFEDPVGSTAFLDHHAPRNVALGRYATQSSDGFVTTPARLAVDGNTDGNYNNGSVTHTGLDPQAWWQVDLGLSHSIGKITLWNRTDCCGYRLTDFYVFVSPNPFTSTNPALTQFQAGVWTAHYTGTAGTSVDFTTVDVSGHPVVGRYVRVQLNGITEPLSLAEVQVFSAQLNPGQCSASECPTLGQTGNVGQAAQFDGVNDRVQATPAFTLANSSFTVAFWAKRNSNGTFDSAFSSGSFVAEQGLLIGFRDNNLFTCAFVSDDLVTAAAYTDTAWHHWACTYDVAMRQRTLYRDGAQVAQDTSIANYQGTGTWFVGDSPWLDPFYDSHFNGGLDEVAVFGYALSAADIRHIGQPAVAGAQGVDVAFTQINSGIINDSAPANQRLYLPLDDNVDKDGKLIFKDLATNAQGTCLNSKCPAVGGEGLRGAAAQFDGDDNYITIKMSDAITGSYTVAVWVKPQPDLPANPIGIVDSIMVSETAAFVNHTNLTACTTCHANVEPVGGSHVTPGTLCSNCHLTTTTWCTSGFCASKSFDFKFLNGNTLQAKIGDRTNWLAQKDTPFNYTLGQWYHVTYVVSPTGYILYVNGAATDSGSLAGLPVLANAGDKLLFGYANGALMKGSLDEARVFDRDLTASEVRSLYLGYDPILILDFENNFADTSTWSWAQTIDRPAADQTPVFKSDQGQVGHSSAAFDGINDQLIIQQPAYSLLNSAFSIGFWAKRNSLGTIDTAFSSGTAAANHGLSVGFRANNKFNCGFSSNDLNTSLSYTDNAWHHWVCTYDSTTRLRSIYRDGVRVALDVTAANYQGVGAWTIGSSTWLAAAPFNGSLDDVRVYPRALSLEEVNAWMLSSFRAASMTTAGAGVPLGAWNAIVPIGLEGVYQLNARGRDMNGLRDLTNLGNEQWLGLVDSLAPRIANSYKANAQGQTRNVFTVQDYDLDLNGFKMSGVCSETGTTKPKVYDANLINSNQVWYRMGGGEAKPFEVQVSCSQNGVDQSALALTACDLLGNCTPPTIPQTAANNAIIYSPVNGSVFTTTSVVSVTGAALASLAYLHTVNLTVDGTSIFSNTFPSSTVTQTTIAANWVTGRTYQYENVPPSPVTMYDLACAPNVTFAVKDSFTVTDLNVGLNLAHADRGDLYITLTAPDSSAIVLLFPDGNTANDVDVWLTDASASNVQSDGTNHTIAAPYYENVRQPYQALAAFNGKAAQGNWVLSVCDSIGPGNNDPDGTYNRAVLSFNTANSAGPFVSHAYENLPSTPISIPDNLCATSVDVEFIVPAAFTVSDLQVGLNFTHTWRSDLYVELTAPDSTYVALHNIDNNSADNLDVWLTDDAAISVNSDLTNHTPAAPYYDNARRPSAALSAFKGVSAQGTWTLTICDQAGADLGTFNRAELSFNAVREGKYDLQLQVLDWLGQTISSPIVNAYLDFTAPQIGFGGPQLTAPTFGPSAPSVASLVLTGTAYALPVVRFSGSITEAAGIVSLTLKVGNTIVPGSVDGNRWSAGWPVPDVSAPPDGVTLPFTVTAADVAGRVATISSSAIVDVLAPVAQPKFSIDGKPITSSFLITQTGAHTYTLNLPPATDGSGVAGYWFGDTVTPDFALSNLNFTPYSGSPINVTKAISLPYDGRDVYLHFVTSDIYGNQSDASHQNKNAETLGPIYFDAPTAPDYTGMNELAGPYVGGPYRGWMDNGCSYLGQDLRVPFKASKGEALADGQKLYATWGTWTPVGVGLRLTWSGADWNRDGDLFMYLDTVPDQMPSGGNGNTYIRKGGNVAYNPYSATMSGTLMMLPVAAWDASVNTAVPNWPTLDRMNADYAVWVESDSTIHFLSWNTGQNKWIEVALPADLHFNFTTEAGDTPLTEIYLPFAAIGNPAGKNVSLIAFASEDDGLRVWSAIPANNPASSQRVMITAPATDRPLEIAMTDRYTLTIADGQCRQPSYRTYLDVVAEPGGLPFVSRNDDAHLIWPHFNQAAYSTTFNGYDTNYTTWLNNFCDFTDPTADECTALHGLPVTFKPEDKFAPYVDVNYPTLLPGQQVTYTLHYYNDFPTAQNFLLKLDSSQNNDPTLGGGNTIQWSPAPYAWTNGCQNLLNVTLPANSQGHLTLGGTVLLSTRWAAIRFEQAYSLSGCSLTFANTEPYNMLQVFNKIDLDPPSYIAIDQPQGVVSPLTTTVSGGVLDASPVPTITLEVKVGGGSTNTVTCPDDTSTDGAWECLINAKTLNGGSTPADGTALIMRAKGTDIFGHVSAWTSWHNLIIDAQPPTATLSAATLINLADGLIGPAETSFTGLAADNHLLSSIDVCDTGSNCTAAALTLDPLTIPQPNYIYNDVPVTPLTIADGASGICGTNVNATFTITDVFTVKDLSVGLNITHTYRGDLRAQLKGPDNTIVLLLNNGGANSQNVDVNLTDASASEVDTDYASHDPATPYYDNERHPSGLLTGFKGKAAAGSWVLSICDAYAADIGTYNRAQLNFSADTTPQNTHGNWAYTYPFTQSLDGVFRTLNVYGEDSVGNRMSAPLVITFTADNVAPMLIVTQTQTTLNIGTPAQPIALTGVVSDGVGVQGVSVSSLSPSGQVQVDSVNFLDGGVNLLIPHAVTSWNYALTPQETGLYHLSVIASDLAGNTVQVGTYNVQVSEPLAVVTPTYALTILTTGAGTGTVTPTAQASYLFSEVVTLTAVAGPNSLFTGWSGDVVTTTNPVTLRIYGNTNVTALFDIGGYYVYLPVVKKNN
jgi:subtilisin-like proprotein convertase family protein